MEFVETRLFTRQVVEALTDDEYRALQEYLAARPDVGAVIPRGGGIRKLRWVAEGRGKRGGTRVIYYWATARGEILLPVRIPEERAGRPFARTALGTPRRGRARVPVTARAA